MFTLPQGAPAKISRISQAGIVRPDPTTIDISVFYRDLQVDRFANPLISCQRDTRSTIIVYLWHIFYTIRYICVHSHCYLVIVMCNIKGLIFACCMIGKNIYERN